ncbi:hypothetical protein D3C83_239620 [compost metagenome]
MAEDGKILRRVAVSAGARPADAGAADTGAAAEARGALGGREYERASAAAGSGGEEVGAGRPRRGR